MKFAMFYEQEIDDWRERKVWHITPTGQRNHVKIKSLSPEEQEKYKPALLDLHVKKKKKSAENKNPEKKEKEKKASAGEILDPDLLDFYYIINSPEDIDKIEKGKLIKATDLSSKAIEWSGDDKYIVSVSNVPIKAVVLYKNDEGEMVHFPENMKTHDKYEFIKFQENDEFLLNLFPFLEQITIKLSDKEEKK